VKTGLITSRRIIFTPTQDLKDELADTAIQITCYDRNGEIVKRVTSADAGNVEDPETSPSTSDSETSPNPSEGGENQGGDSGDNSNQGGDNTGGSGGGDGDDEDMN
jgi:hypothetical protein